MSHLAFTHPFFGPIKPDWPRNVPFWAFLMNFCKLSSLRSQCWMRLFLWISNTVCTYCRVDIEESLRVWVFSCFLLGPLALKEVLLPQYWLNCFRFLSTEINLRSSLFVELLSVFKRSTWTSPSMTNASAIYAPSHFILIADKMRGKSPQMSHWNSKINVVEMRSICDFQTLCWLL